MSSENGIEGEAWAIVGKRKSGKTTTCIDDFLNGVPPNLVFAREVHGTKLRDWGATILPMKELVEKMLVAVDMVFVVDDASPLFKGRIGEMLGEALVRSRDFGVTIIFMFHSWRLLPFDIFDMINGIVIHKTRDLAYRVTDRTDDEDIYYAFLTVNESDNPHERAIIEIED